MAQTTKVPKNVEMQASEIPAQVAEFGRSRRKTLTIEAVLYPDTGEVRMTPGEAHTYTREQVTQWADSVVQFAIDQDVCKIVQGAEGSSLRVLTNLMTTPKAGTLRGKRTFVLLNQAVASGWVLSKRRKANRLATAIENDEAYYAINVPDRAFPSAKKAANASLRADNPDHEGTINELENFATLRAEARKNMVVQGKAAVKEALESMTAKECVSIAKSAGAPTSVKTKAQAIAHLC